MQTDRRMPRVVPWLVAGLLVAAALVVALRDRGVSAPTVADEAASAATEIALAADEPATDSLQQPDRPEGSQGLSAWLLSDSEGSRRNLFGMTIREAGYDCPDVRSAETLDRNGHAWRANCGNLRLYWIKIDEFGRMSVEPGTYDDSGFGVDSVGGRTITIQPED